MEEINTNISEDIIYENPEDWKLVGFNKKKLRAKKTLNFGATLDRLGVYSVQIKILNQVSMPGRNALTKVSILSPTKMEIFQDDKTLHPTINVSKNEMNTWFLFVPIEQDTVNSYLSIDFESNAHFRSLVVSTLIRYKQGNNREENMTIIDTFNREIFDLDHSIPLQLVLLDDKPSVFKYRIPSKNEDKPEAPSSLPSTDGHKANSSTVDNRKSKLITRNEYKKRQPSRVLSEDDPKSQYYFGNNQNPSIISNDNSQSMSMIPSNSNRKLKSVAFSNDNQESDVSAKRYLKNRLISKTFRRSQANLLEEANSTTVLEDEESFDDFLQKEIEIERMENGDDSTSKGSFVEEITENDINNLKNPKEQEQIDIVDQPFKEETMFEECNHKISAVKRYHHFSKIDAGYYTLFIKSLKNPPKKGFRLSFKTFSDIPFDPKSDQVLIEKCVEKPITIPEGTTYEKAEIYVPIDDCNFSLKISTKSLRASWITIKLVKTKLLHSLPLTNQKPYLIGERSAAPKKEIWSVQKTLGLKECEIIEVELEPGCYNFFVTKISKVDLSFRDFSCSLALFDKKSKKFHNSKLIDNIWILKKIGTGTKHDDNESVNFEIQNKCCLQIKFESAYLATPVTFFARIGKLNEVKLQFIKDPFSLFKLSAYLGLTALMEYYWLAVGVYIALAAIGLDEEFMFFSSFMFWLEYAEEIPKLNKLCGI